MRTYPCAIVGLPYEGRAAYVKKNVREGDAIKLRREPDNAYDRNAVACFHEGRQIGYIPSKKGWVCRSIDEGDLHEVLVVGLNTDDDGSPVSLDIEITIVSDGNTREAPKLQPPPPLIDQIGDELRVLAMVAVSDGRFQAPERAVLEKYAGIRAVELGIDADENEIADAVGWARRRVPPLSHIDSLIASIASKGQNALHAMWEVSEIVSEIDEKQKDAELMVISSIRDAIRVRLA